MSAGTSGLPGKGVKPVTQGQGHPRTKIDLEAWWTHHSRPVGLNTLCVLVIFYVVIYLSWLARAADMKHGICDVSSVCLSVCLSH